ncbi:MAG: TetR/AcrR family transcriptional regulator [Saprospiraceae bacterium]
MITREKIIEEATRLFTNHGVKSVTINRIVQHLHTSKRTIYNHFADKGELLEACLAVYHQKVKKENEVLLTEADNAIEAMGKLYNRIIGRASQVNPSFFNDILHYHPGLLQKSYRETNNFAHQQLYDLGKWGMKDGIFRADLDVEVVTKTVLVMLELLKDTDRFPVQEFSKERLTFGILVPYLRGVCTPKGQELLHEQSELFRIMI